MAPGSGALALERALRTLEQAADLPVEVLPPDLEAARVAPGPLMLLFPTPDLALAPECLPGEGEALVAGYSALQDLVSSLGRRPVPPSFRLVNLSLSSMASLIGWAVQALMAAQAQTPQAPSPGIQPAEPDLWFRPEPDPTDALVALQLLRLNPAVEAAYLALEQHPQAAAADQRPPDLAYGERLRAVASLANLVKGRQAAAALDRQLRDLGGELGGARAELIDAAWIREQLGEQIQQMQEQLRLQGLQIEQEEKSKHQLHQQLCQVIQDSQQESQRLQARLAEAQANQAEIQASLEQAVRCSRSQRDLHAAMALVIRGLQGQIGRLQGG